MLDYLSSHDFIAYHLDWVTSDGSSQSQPCEVVDKTTNLQKRYPLTCTEREDRNSQATRAEATEWHTLGVEFVLDGGHRVGLFGEEVGLIEVDRRYLIKSQYIGV